MEGDWEEEINNLQFYSNHDEDLLNNEDISFRSTTGSTNCTYSSNPLETPQDFKYTSAYYSCPNIRQIIDFFQIEKTRISLHQQKPNVFSKLPIDTNIKVSHSNYRATIIIPMNYNEEFIYFFKPDKQTHILNLPKGKPILFDPDLVKYGTANKSENKIRYLLVITAKPNKWLYSFFKKRKKNVRL